MKALKILSSKSAELLASSAHAMAVLSANSTCILVYHQPKAPEKLASLKRNKQDNI